MERYIGLDVHGASSTFVVLAPNGKELKTAVVETNGESLIEFLKLIPGHKHLCFEEGTQSEWLYEILSRHVGELVVTGLRATRGNKDDRTDAHRLAEALRTGAIETRVFKKAAEFGRLRDLARIYRQVVGDVVRVKNRLKSLYRARGIATVGLKDRAFYQAEHRDALVAELPLRTQDAARLLFEEHDRIMEVRKKLEKELVAEAKKHAAFKLLSSCPGLGAIRVAELLPVVVTPHRFRTKRQFWAYCGLAVVTRSSSDWVRSPSGDWARARVPMTRGLNRNHNHTLKGIFKGAATTAIALKDSELSACYERLIAAGTKPNLAKLTIARKIAATTLSMWKHEEVYDRAKSNVKKS
jgi:transposase